MSGITIPTTIIDRLDADLGRIADLMVARIREEIPAYRAIVDESIIADVRSDCEENVRIIARSWRTGDGGPAGTDLGFIHSVATRRASQLVPLDALLHAYRVGQRVLWEWILEVGRGRSGWEAVVLDLTATVLRHIDVVSTALADAYVKETQRLRADLDRARRDLLEDLVTGRFLGREGAAIRAVEIGLDPRASYLLAVFQAARPSNAEDGSAQLGRIADVVTQCMEEDGHAALVVSRHQETVAVRSAADGRFADDARRAVSTLRSRGVIVKAGVSTPGDGLAGIARAYEEAHGALEMARSSDADVVALTEASLLDYLVARADATARRVVADGARLLADADARAGGDLVETLSAYVETGLNVEATARRLVVHANTVHYRLRKIASITDRDVRAVREALDLVLGVRVLRQQGEGAH